MATRQRPSRSRSRPTTRLGPRTAASTASTPFSTPMSTAPPTSTAPNHPHHHNHHNDAVNRAEVLLATLGTVLVVGVCVAALFLLVRRRRQMRTSSPSSFSASPPFQPPPPPSYSSIWSGKEGLAYGGQGGKEGEWVNEKEEGNDEKEEGREVGERKGVSPGKCEEGHAGRGMMFRQEMDMRTGADGQVHRGRTVGRRGGVRSALDRAVGVAQDRLSKLGQRFSTAAAGVSSEEERVPSPLPLPPPPCLGKDVEAGSASGYASGSEKDGCRIDGQGDGSDAWDEFAARAGAGRVGWLGRYTGAADCLVRKRGSPRQPAGGDCLV